jgi:hypothetical protein
MENCPGAENLPEKYCHVPWQRFPFPKVIPSPYQHLNGSIGSIPLYTERKRESKWS